ncbi:MAG: hypothetical protein AAGF01_16150 [Cyanobacteria bacterium P01_G01_bin.38]
MPPTIVTADPQSPLLPLPTAKCGEALRLSTTLYPRSASANHASQVRDRQGQENEQAGRQTQS